MATPGLFDTGQVFLGRSGGNQLPQRTGSAPYLPLQPIGTLSSPSSGPAPAPKPPTLMPTAPVGQVSAQSVRATAGPFDPAYRQNLATFSGGQFNRPGGQLTFDPTATAGAPSSLFGDLGGTGPTDLLSQALGGGALSFMNPVQPPTSPTKKKQPISAPQQNQYFLGGRAA